MELIEQYIYAVGKRLPRKQRADIEKELRSLIMDELDAKTGDGEPDKEDITAVLRKMGPPAEVAARYAEKGQYLIGPALFPLYKMICGIVLGAVLLGMTISVVIGLLQVWADTGEVFRRLGALVPQFITGGASAVGFITIAFALMERFMPEKQIKSLQDSDLWDPADLPEVPAKYDETKPWEEVLGIVLTVAVIVLFNAFSDVIAIYGLEGRSSVPLLSQQALHDYLPLWNIVWGLGIGKSVLLLYRGRWELGTHIYDNVLSLLSIAVLAVMIAGPRLLNETVLGMIRDTTTTNIPVLMRSALVLGLGAAIVVKAVETGRKIYRLIRDRVQANSESI